jgi:DNA repair protein RecN (Recombination protein N)
MLLSLRIENFALIDHLELTFGSGLNVLTGETGAGKSIILDALDLVLGGKASSRIIRTGASKALLEASFQISDRLSTWLEVAEIDPLDEGILVCSRDISNGPGANGQGVLRSRSRVNGVLVNKQQMESLRDRLVEITAQGQTLQLGQPALQRDWLDAFGGPTLLEQRSKVNHDFVQYQNAQQQLEQYRKNQQQHLQQLDMLHYQLQELHEVELTDPEEQTQLTQEYQRLSHSVELQQQSYEAYQILYDHPQGGACADLLGRAAAILEQMSDVDVQVKPISDLVQDALTQVQEAGTQVHRYGDALETDPQRLADVEGRLQQLKQICRKYGPTLSDAIAHQTRIETDLAALTGDGASLGALEQSLTEAEVCLTQSCELLTALRRSAAADLEARLVAELKPLAMEKVQFQVLLKQVEPIAYGADRITFVFSPNPGEPMQPLAETASGGEMSRFLLALKACFSQIDPVATFVFDEVDVGVSGRVAQAIAEKLHHLSRNHQILCVTHQPIVAAMADHHFQVEKQVVAQSAHPDSVDGESELSDRTVVRIQPLMGVQRPLALAQLAGGDASNPMMAFAESLLQQATHIRQGNQKHVDQKQGKQREPNQKELRSPATKARAKAKRAS